MHKWRARLWLPSRRRYSHAIAQARREGDRSVHAVAFHSGAASRMRDCQLTPRDADGADARGPAAAGRPVQTSGSPLSTVPVRTSTGSLVDGADTAALVLAGAGDLG